MAEKKNKVTRNRVTGEVDSPETTLWKQRAAEEGNATRKTFPGTRDQYIELAAYWMEDQWDANPNNPSPMRGFKERFGTFESTIAGETRYMQPKTSSKYNKAQQGPPGESPKGVTLVSSDTVDSYSETRRFNEAIPIEIETTIRALELRGSFKDGSPLPKGFGLDDFRKKVSSGIGDLKKIQKILKAQGHKIDKGHWLPIGSPEIDNAARHRGEGPPNLEPSLRLEDSYLNKSGGARPEKDPKRSALAVMGVPRTWKEVLGNYMDPTGTPGAKSMFGNTAELEAFAQWSRGKTDVEINDYVARLESSNMRGLQQYDPVSGRVIGQGNLPTQKAPDLPTAKWLRTKQTLANTIKAAGLQRRFDKREAVFDAVDSLTQGDFVRAVGAVARLTPQGAAANIVGEGLNALTQATTGQSLGDRAKLLTDTSGTQLNIEAQIARAKNLRNNRRYRNALRTVWKMPVPEISPNQRFSYSNRNIQIPTTPTTTKKKINLTKMRRR